jgi:hypothetical protein
MRGLVLAPVALEAEPGGLRSLSVVEERRAGLGDGDIGEIAGIGEPKLEHCVPHFSVTL